MRVKWLRMFRTKQPKTEAVLLALSNLAEIVEKKSIPEVMDDWDAGYNIAVDEMLAVINDAINQIASDNDVDYSGGI
jgi:hypothetical protein